MDALRSGLEARYGREHTERLYAYMREILEANREINLTAVRDEHVFAAKHIWDSLSITAMPVFRESRRIADVGTGAGFPGVPLAVVAPEKSFVLMDALQKRLRVVAAATEKLGIGNIELLHARAEEAGRQPLCRERFDLVVSRALASLDVLAEWCLPLVRVGGQLVAYKGDHPEEEIAEAEAAIRAMGARLRRVERAGAETPEDALREISGHTLVCIEKVKPTPQRYPRRPCEARRAPIR